MRARKRGKRERRATAWRMGKRWVGEALPFPYG
jgi:hypothetical protein